MAKQHSNENDPSQLNLVVTLSNLKLLTYKNSKLVVMLKWFGSQSFSGSKLGSSSWEFRYQITSNIEEYVRFCSSSLPAEILINRGHKCVGYCKINAIKLLDLKSGWESELTIVKGARSTIPVGSIRIACRVSAKQHNIQTKGHNQPGFTSNDQNDYTNKPYHYEPQSAIDVGNTSYLERSIPIPQELNVTTASIDPFQFTNQSLDRFSSDELESLTSGLSDTK